MPTQLEKAREYLDVLEAERLAALALSEQKAAEAKLIKARLEGFQAAMEMLGDEISSSSFRTWSECAWPRAGTPVHTPTDPT